MIGREENQWLVSQDRIEVMARQPLVTEDRIIRALCKEDRLGGPRLRIGLDGVFQRSQSADTGELQMVEFGGA